jgi:hypothetical protein
VSVPTEVRSRPVSQRWRSARFVRHEREAHLALAVTGAIVLIWITSSTRAKDQGFFVALCAMALGPGQGHAVLPRASVNNVLRFDY